MRTFLVFLSTFFLISCNKCKECEVTSTSSLKQTYSFPVEGVPNTDIETLELCEDQLDAVEGKTLQTDSLYNGIEINVTRSYVCK